MENLLIPVFESHYAEKGELIKVYEGGVDNSGRLITDEEADQIGEKMGAADWKIHWLNHGKISYVEAMVHSECFGTSSFKEGKLKRQLRDNNPIAVLRETHFDLYKPELLAEILKRDMEYLPGKYGSGPGRIMWQWELNEWVKEGKLQREYWNAQALSILNTIKLEAFPPKQ